MLSPSGNPSESRLNVAITLTTHRTSPSSKSPETVPTAVGFRPMFKPDRRLGRTTTNGCLYNARVGSKPIPRCGNTSPDGRYGSVPLTVSRTSVLVFPQTLYESVLHQSAGGI